jgi:uroporphyrinogen-III synthase
MKGRRIAVLEARLGKQLVELVAARGGVPFHAPALAEVPDLDRVQIGRLVEALEASTPSAAIFQTGAGTRALFAATDGLGVTDRLMARLEKAVVVVRGPKPTAALRSRGVRIDRSAADPFTTREVLEAMADVPVKGTDVLVQRHGVVNTELDNALAARGARVTEIPVYRWSLPQDTAPLAELVARLVRGELDGAAFTNAEQARNLFAVAAQLGQADAVRKALNTILVASIGPVASAALKDVGVKVGFEAHPPKLGALLAGLESAFP